MGQRRIEKRKKKGETQLTWKTKREKKTNLPCAQKKTRLSFRLGGGKKKGDVEKNLEGEYQGPQYPAGRNHLYTEPLEEQRRKE